MRLPVSRHLWLFLFVVASLGVAGYLLGRTLAAHPKLETFKLLNIAGLSYDFLGLMVLTETVAKNEQLKSFVVSWLAGTVLWVQTIVPLGAAFGAGFASNAPSGPIASSFFISFWIYSIFVLAALEASVFYPRVPEMQEPTGRSRRFGVLLLISGVLVQLIAAFKDLYV
jgi:hypothetical protein